MSFNFKIKEIENNKQKKIENDLDEIYKIEKKGAKLDFSHLEHKKKSKTIQTLMTILFFLFIVFGVSVASFLIFNKETKFSGEKLIFKIEGPAEISSESEIAYQINLNNQEDIDLVDLFVEVKFPADFKLKFSSFKPTENPNIWKIEKIKAGETKQIKILGQFLGEVGTSKTISAILNYRPINFSSSFFEKNNSITTILNKASVVLNINAPEKVLADGLIDYEIKYKNNTLLPIEAIKMIIEFPEAFELIKSDPEILQNDNDVWFFSNLQPGEEKILKINGKIKGALGEIKELKVSLGIVDSDNKFRLQTEKTSIVFLISSNLFVELRINSQTLANQSANLGDTLNYEIFYKNNGEMEIKNLTFEVRVISPNLRWQKIETKTLPRELELISRNPLYFYNFLNSMDQESFLTWSRDQVPQLFSLKPGEEGSIPFKIILQDKIFSREEGVEDKKNLFKNFYLESIIKAKAKIANLEESNFEINSSKVTTKIKTQTELKIETMPLENGNWPPKIDTESEYQINWKLNNAMNNLKNIKVSTFLPENVTWKEESKVSTGEIKYNPETREVSWEINWLPTYVGEPFSETKIEANFKLSIKPEWLNENIILLKQTALKADDEFIQDSISTSYDQISID
ncbi:hypothetical protein CVV26_01625 [Candidatus Kuenenbacteria bacterium HGW-Kuenenbacteria-1]|uniref:DUF11 domain-containing protein n=1 Tax=Candidatus Kuenenbacteria bacterium HGW-Kuenenbacteria-1 TaxID=2013812 RepID=A0A2N1UNJ4_9BACT|nr:MAG: hypothetical protein CVV26_01625 [Candidatus Kuenenbacteria bacterium HGW-Kuenenbacteria-1]